MTMDKCNGSGLGIQKKRSNKIGESPPHWIQSVPKIVPQGKTRVDGGLREGRGNRELGKGVIVEEHGVQALAQGVIRREFQGHQLLARSDLIGIDVQVTDDGEIVP